MAAPGNRLRNLLPAFAIPVPPTLYRPDDLLPTSAPERPSHLSGSLTVLLVPVIGRIEQRNRDASERRAGTSACAWR